MSNTNNNFDPFTQNIIVYHKDGTPHEVPINYIDWWNQYAVRTCIDYSAQLGASLTLIVVTLLLTKPDKRRSAVFFINNLALLCNGIRLLCEIVYFTGGFVHLYPFLEHDFSRIPRSAYGTSIAGLVFLWLVVVCMEMSLVLQAQVVCANLRRRYRRALLGVSIVVALVPIGFRLAQTVANSKAIMATVVAGSWLESTSNIIITVSICFFCLIFVIKLAFAIKLRRTLGIRDFGPMKVIFVMGCQTMVIPALISILQYCTNIPQLTSNVITLVVISLPLSSIWAASNLEQTNMARRCSSHISDANRHLIPHNPFQSPNTTTTTNTNTNSNTVNSVVSSNNSSSSSGSSMLQMQQTNSRHLSIDETLTGYAGAGSGAGGPNSLCYADAARASGSGSSTGAAERFGLDLEVAKYGISVEHDISVHSFHKDMS